MLDVSLQYRVLSGAAWVLLGDIRLRLMLYMSYLLWLWTVWWHLSVFTLVGEKRPPNPTVIQCWQGCKKFILCLSGTWTASSQTWIDCDKLSLFRLSWYKHFTVDVKRQLPRCVRVKLNFYVLPLWLSSVLLHYTHAFFFCFVHCLPFHNSLVDLTWGSCR